MTAVIDISNHLPLRYEDTQDYCEVYDKNGEKVALTTRPELFRALERSSEQAAHGWQPIETAPRDGTQVLLWAEAWEMTWGIQIGSFEGEKWRTSEGTVDDNGPDFDPEADVDDDFDCDENAGPTHWMPLPAIPASVSSPVTEKTDG